MEAPLRILIVDDNYHSAYTLARLLELSGYETRAAHDGKAIELARDFRPDVFLIDLAMPDIDGYTLAREIRQQPQHKEALLIAFSGFQDPEHMSREKEAGFAHFLMKPVDLSLLRSILEGKKENSLVTSSCMD